jgi:tripartite-type tricarboxylate transporter receptor subunit TctC
LRSPALLSVPTSLGVKNFEEFKAYVATGEKQISYGTWGIGSLGHLAAETLAKQMKFNAVHIPQRGEAPVLQDLLTNTINCGWTSAGTARPNVLAGKIVLRMHFLTEAYGCRFWYQAKLQMLSWQDYLQKFRQLPIVQK